MNDDVQKPNKPAVKSNEAVARDARLNAALRANLQKRKQQGRKRAAPGVDVEVAKPADTNEG